MRVHHLNCGTFCPFGGRLMDGVSRGAIGHLVCHCLLVETDRDGLALVDTGLGLRDMREPFPRLSRLYANLLNIRFDPEQSAVRQVERLVRCARRAPRRADPPRLRPRGRDRGLPRGHRASPRGRGRGGAAPSPGLRGRAPLPAAAMGRHVALAALPRRPGEPWFGFEAVRDLLGCRRRSCWSRWSATRSAMPAWRSARRRLAAQRRRRLLLPRRGRLQGIPLPTGAARLPAADGGGPGRPARNQARLREPSWRSPSCG